MDNSPNIQAMLFNEIKKRLPPNVSFVHVVSELLELSYDSAYRRIRGEKTLSLEELQKISTKFKISIDSFLNLDSSNVVFGCHSLEPEKFRIKEWLGTILFDLKRIKESSQKEIIYAAKDPPIFHYFEFPEIATFKMFFYQKTLLRFPEFQDKQLSLDEIDTEILEVGKQILALSNKIPTIEIWNEDTFRITLRQIEYYWVAGYFNSRDDVLRLCDTLERWLRHIQKQAEYGMKFLPGQDPDGIENSFKMYENEVVLNDNSIFVRTEKFTAIYMTFNVLSLLITTNQRFCTYVEEYMRGLLKESILISVTGTKERNRFFNKLLTLVQQFKSTII